MDTGYVADEFCNNHCFTDTSAAEQSDFAAFDNRADEIDDFNSRFKNFGGG